jgi:hypothetical protein
MKLNSINAFSGVAYETRSVISLLLVVPKLVPLSFPGVPELRQWEGLFDSPHENPTLIDLDSWP